MTPVNYTPLNHTPKFAYPLAIEGTEEELKALVPKLEKLGYSIVTGLGRNYEDVYGAYRAIKTDFGPQNGVIGYISWKEYDDHIFVNANNPDLVLALAAMREGNEFHVGESVILAASFDTKGWDKVMGHNGFYTVSKTDGEFLYTKERPIGKNYGDPNYYMNKFRKATKEEIIAHYTKEKEKKELSRECQVNVKNVSWQNNMGETRAGTLYQNTGFEVNNFFGNTIVNNKEEKFGKMKEKEKKIIGYKLIKEYPGSFKVGHEYYPAPTGAPYNCANYPEFWEPVYAPEKLETMEYDLPNVGRVTFNRGRKAITMGYDIFNPSEILEIANWQYELNRGFRDAGYLVNATVVNIGCRTGVLVADLVQMIAAYDKFVNG